MFQYFTAGFADATEHVLSRRVERAPSCCSIQSELPIKSRTPFSSPPPPEDIFKFYESVERRLLQSVEELLERQVDAPPEKHSRTGGATFKKNKICESRDS
ncbi:hypothetical protein AVEN_118733-1 [Araneus ventricosus]|uniref:Uncharacterized protein n=1 Tax=Araneus ventricosus TaxID=182803 RepID=A0A4Y2BW68_ARAVE|nr:hypothetical protein AVEN_118733-1 [Araneus ventricosus]